MDSFDHEEPAAGLWLRRLAFVASAALAAAALRLAWYKPILTATMLGVVLTALVAFGVARWLARRRLRRVLQSGDVHSVLSGWSRRLRSIPHPATMAPLMTATAFAAYGWVEKARAALAAAERGPVWEAALEHRLFLNALLLTFEGDRDGALEQADRLERLPLPQTDEVLRSRIRLLRKAVGALTRAFAHRSEPGDRHLLEHVSETSPLVFWAMRYAAAVIAVDQGDVGRARELIAGAPEWPTESTFHAFHSELADRAGMSR